MKKREAFPRNSFPFYTSHMELDGQRDSVNPKAMLQSRIRKREKLQQELRSVQAQVYELETSYLQDSHFGNVWKGLEDSSSLSKSTTNLKRSRKLEPEDRLFSLSSVTSLATEELGAGHDEGKSDFSPALSKGGGVLTNGQGKTKKGRPASRDGKRTRLSREPNID